MTRAACRAHSQCRHGPKTVTSRNKNKVETAHTGSEVYHYKQIVFLYVYNNKLILDKNSYHDNKSYV